MDPDAVHADANRAGRVTQVPPGGVDASRLMVVLLDVVPVRDVGVTHAGSIRAPSASAQRSTAAASSRRAVSTDPDATTTLLPGLHLVAHLADPSIGRS
jgi:hypothetical protein